MRRQRLLDYGNDNNVTGNMSEAEDLDGFDPHLVFNSNPIAPPGNATLILHPKQEQVLGRCAMFPFGIVTREDEKLLYRGLTIIVPPMMVWPHDEEATLELLIHGIAEMQGEPSDATRAALRRRITFRRSATLSTSAVLDEIRATGPKQFALVPWVTLYRASETSPGRPPEERIRLVEDSWASDTAELARAALEIALEKELFLLLTSPADPPMKEETLKLLENVEGLLLSATGGSDQVPPASQLARWAALAKGGRASEAMDQLQALQLPELLAEQMRMQISNAAGDHETAVRIIRGLLPRVSVDGAAAVQWASICILGGDHATARQLLSAALVDMADQLQLEQSLEMATELRRADLVEIAQKRLRALFPNSDRLLVDCDVRLLQLCSMGTPETQEHLISHVGFSEHHTFIAAQLTANVALAYDKIVEDVSAQWPEQQELASMCVSLRAEALGSGVDAMLLALPLIGESRFSRGAARLLLRVMRKLFLSGEVSKTDVDLLKAPLAAVIAHLGQHPGDADLRAQLIKTLSVDRAGSIGLPLLAVVTLDFALTAPLPAPEPVDVEEATEDEFEGFKERWTDSLGGSSGAIDPRVPFPSSIGGPNADRLARAMLRDIERSAPQLKTVEELQDCEYLLHLLPKVAANVPGCADDIHAVRTLAGRYALLGAHQLARDRAELVMLLSSGPPQRRRLAWAAYADIYLRTHSIPDALLGLACAASTQAQLPASELSQEIFSLARVTRELGLLEVSQSALDACRELYTGLGMTEIMRHRLDATALSLRLRKITAADVAGLGALLNDCQTVLEDAMRLKDEVTVAGFLFAQVATAYESAGGQVSAEASNLRSRTLELLGEGASTMLRAVSASKPTAGDLLALHKASAGARYSADAPRDAYSVSIAAHRLLRPENAQATPRDAFFAAELLADRGLTQALSAPLSSADWPLQFAQELAQRGYPVLMLAFDDKRELVAAIADATGAYVASAPVLAEHAEARLAKWSKTYPYRYGLISPKAALEDERTKRMRLVGDAEFYDSMRQFDVPLPQGQRLLVVAQPEAAQLAFNLLVNDGELLGFSRALGMVPSLTWLAATLKKPRNVEVDRRVAWISAGRSSEELQALEVVRAMIEPPMKDHNVSLDLSEALPQGTQGAQMGIVVAHGQLTSDDRYFRRVVDEGKLQAAPDDLADAFADTELVILFVCSGGRVNVDPMVSTTLGLPKLLLNRGCRTVVASPWPLESLAPGIWLPRFLDEWAQGATAIDACHRANLHVASRREGEPQVSLAMTVYGDPLLTKPSVVPKAGQTAT